MSQIIVKDQLNKKNILRRVINTAKARVISSPNGAINFKASLKENRQRNNIVFRSLTSNAEPGWGFVVSIT
jgi:hypothetical protein